MTKIFLRLFVLWISISISFAQFDARRLPAFLNVEKDLIKKNEFYKPGKFPAEAYKEHALPKLFANSQFKIVNISGNSQSQTETWITINPQNPLSVVSASNDTRYNSLDARYMMGAYSSSDGGQSWTTSTTPSNLDAGIIKPPTAGGMTNFDPGLTFDTKGNVFYSYGFCQTPDNGTEGDNGIFVCISSNGGKSWGPPVTVVKSVNDPLRPFNDRYTITCDVSLISPYQDNLYIAWQRFGVNAGVCFSKSTDHGKTWSSAVKLAGTNSDTQSPIPVTGPNGELYIVWQYKSSLSTSDAVIQRSTDGGTTWLPKPITIQTLRNIGLLNSQSLRNVLYDKQSMRISSYPAVAVDNSNSPRNGTIYVVQNGKDNSNLPGILLSKSTDNGLSWSKSYKIDGNITGTDVFHPAITVDPVTGNVGVFYYSSQNDSANKGVDGYFAISSDGNNFKQYRLTSQTWYLSGVMSVDMQGSGNYYWGDYTSIASFDGRYYPCFWMPNSPNGAFWTNNVYTALISNEPMPPENLNATNSYLEPSKVILKWKDPSFDLFGNSLSDFKIVIYRDNTEIAQINRGTEQFTDNAAVDGTPFSYSIRTRITSGKLSSIVSVTGIAGGATQPLQPTSIFGKPISTGVLLFWTNPSMHIDSSALNDLNRIDIFSDGNLVKSVSVPEIQSGSNSSTLLNLPLKSFHEIKLAAVSKRGTLQTSGTLTDSIIVYSGSPIINFYENFDNQSDSLAFYSKGLKGGWERTNKAAYSLPWSLTDSPNGKYLPAYNNQIILAPVKIQASESVLTFRHIALIEPINDAGILKISKDFGQTWENIGWFNQDSSTEFTGDITTSKWQLVSRDLKNYANDTILIAFSLISNAVQNRDGWYIDNLMINDGTAVFEEMAELADKSVLKITPNPAYENININFGLPLSGNCSLELYDVYGNLIKIVASGYHQAGEYSSITPIDALSQGVYYIKMTINGFSKLKKFVKITE